MIRHKKFLSYFKPLSFLPAILIMCLIFSFSAQTGEESGSLSHKISVQIVEIGNFIFQQELTSEDLETYADKIETPVRKLAHMTEYCIFALTIMLPLFIYGVRGKCLILSTIIFCICFAAGDEYHQSFVAGRGPSVKDVMIDSVGVGIGSALGKLFSRTHWFSSH